jgi:3-oxoacyl-[acyl-carrier protein] reductase
MGRLDGRVAMVTGASRGIGEATARRFAREGARVCLTDAKLEGALSTARQLVDEGMDVFAARVDVTNRSEVENAVKETVERHGRLDILVNNAGVTRDNLFYKMTDDDWRTVLNVHLGGAFFCTRAVQKHMVEHNYGRIVNVSSLSALGNRGQANYSAAKAGIQGFTKTLAIELGRYGVTVNAVAPGFIETDARDRGQAGHGLRRFCLRGRRRHPRGPRGLARGRGGGHPLPRLRGGRVR